MREIKFRVWDTWESKFFEPTYEAYKGNLSELLIGLSGQVIHRTLEQTSIIDHQNGRWIVNLYTGLKDKNGREIYEGDIIRFDEKNIGFIDCEDWLEFFVHWIGEPDCTDYARDFYRIGRSEVIGNVHENPELL